MSTAGDDMPHRRDGDGGLGAKVHAAYARWGDLITGVGLLILGVLIAGVAIWGQVQQNHTNDEIQRSRIEASKQACLNLGNTNRTVIALLEASYKSSRENPRPGQPSDATIRKLVDNFEAPLRTPGAAPPVEAERACDAAAHKAVEINK